MALAIVCAGVPWPAGLVEQVYALGVYRRLQRVLTGVSNLIPVALIDVLLAGAAVGLVLSALAIRRAAPGIRVRCLGRFAWKWAGAAAAAYLAFMLCWGFNYQRVPLTGRLDFDERRATPQAAAALADESLAQLSALSGAGWRQQADDDEAATAEKLRIPFQAALASIGTAGGTVPGRPKRSVLDPYFTRAGVSGMTDPWFLETLVASDVLPVERPVVIAHEWAHLAGLAAESEASFAAWVTCLGGDERVRYSAWLDIFMHALGAVEPDERQALLARVPDGVREDFRRMAERNERDQVRWVGRVAWRTYDSYLKSQRVSSGVRNYSEVIRLMLGTRFDAGWRPARPR